MGTKHSILILECLLLLSVCLGCIPIQPSHVVRTRRHAAKRCPSCPRDCAEALAGPGWMEPRGRRISRLVADPQPVWSTEEQGLYGTQPPSQEAPSGRNYWRTDPSLRDSPRLDKLRRSQQSQQPPRQPGAEQPERPEQTRPKAQYPKQQRPYKGSTSEDGTRRQTDGGKRKKLYVVYRADVQDEDIEPQETGSALRFPDSPPNQEILTRREVVEIVKQEVARELQEARSLDEGSIGLLKRVKRRKLLGKIRPKHGIRREAPAADSADPESQPDYQLDHEIPPKIAGPSNSWTTQGQVPLKLTQMDDMSMIYSMPMIPEESFGGTVVEMAPEIPYEIATEEDETKVPESRQMSSASQGGSGKEPANRRSEASGQIPVAPSTNPEALANSTPETQPEDAT